MKTMRTNGRRACTILLAVGLIAGATGVGFAATSKGERVSPINGTEGVKSVVEGRSKTKSGEVKSVGFVSVRGNAAYSRGRGLVVSGKQVNISRSTTVYPSIDGLSSGLRPENFSGRELTVIGESGPGGIDASLIIVKLGAEDLRDEPAIINPDAKLMYEPSPDDPNVGAGVEGAPN